MSEHAHDTTDDPDGLDPLALAALADAADEAAALPSPYDGDVAQEDGSDTTDADPGTDEPDDTVEGGEA